MYSTNVLLLCIFPDTIQNHAERSKTKGFSHFGHHHLNLSANFLFLFLHLTVSYLVVFHVFLMMFLWSYWKTIWSTPASPSHAVSETEPFSEDIALL